MNRTATPMASETRPDNEVVASSRLDALCRGLVLRRLSGLRVGRLRIVERDDAHEFGIGTDVLTVHVMSPRFYRRLVCGGSVGAAESYIDGEWQTDNLTAVLRLFLRNRDVLTALNGAAAKTGRAMVRLAHVLNRNTRAGSRRNIAAHYDLGNDFFSLFLDPTMMYSSAVFEHAEMSLEEASVAKLDRICRRLRLSADDHVIEIGTGWGGFAVHAAANYDCRVTTTTISREQFEFATARVAEAGLEHLVSVIFEDYRDLTGQYDKLVSIEMIEAVGLEHLQGYFRKCSSLLKPGGAMLIQSITIADQLFDGYRKGADFIQKYIFPGGALPCVSEMQRVVAESTDLRLIHLEDIAAHYARTLVEWRQRFNDELDSVRCLGFPERFIRMWNYYFCYCEAGFEERSTGTSQLLFAKPGSRLETAQDDPVAARVVNHLDPSVSESEVLV